MTFVFKYLRRVNVYGFVFIGIGIVLLISAIIGLSAKPGSSGENPLLAYEWYFVFLGGVMVAPFLETVVYQAIPFYLIRRFVKHKYKYYLYLIISPVLFIHHFNITYMVATYFVGLIFAFMYYVARFRKENAILLVALIHLVNNLIAFGVHSFG